MDADEREKRRRAAAVRPAVVVALRDEFGLDARRVSLLSISFNTLFRVDLAGGGPPLVVRAGTGPRIHVNGIEAAEAGWLDTIARDTGLGVPRFVPDHRGRHATPVEVGPGDVVPCSVFTWVGGLRLGERFDIGGAERFGEVQATLHTQAERLSPASWMAGLVSASAVITFGDRTRLAHRGGPDAAVVGEAIDRARGVLATIDARADSPPYLIHGDFSRNNVLRRYDRLVPIDMQDLLVGHDVHDLGITLADLRRHRIADDLVAAHRRGYERLRPWPLDPTLEADLAAVRSLNLANFALLLDRPSMDAFVDERVEFLREWMRRA